MAQAFSAAVRRRWIPAWLTIRLPSWLLSVVIHAALIVALGAMIQVRPKGGGTGEVDREVGLVLKQVDSQGKFTYEGPPAESQADGASVPTAAELVGDRPPIDIRDALPNSRELVGIGGLDQGQATGAAGMTQGLVGGKNLAAGYARTKVYGLPGEGFKFVYVFDRSSSMGGSGNTALRAAKAELLASLASLGPTHQFQIIFYNEHPTMFPLAGHVGRLVYATEENKRQAQLFVQGIVADGGTQHAEALDMALNLHPDVIFFLTDADQPELAPSQMLRIRRKNQGAVINTIEFGAGPPLGDENFLMRLARENRGQYAYIDIAKALGR